MEEKFKMRIEELELDVETLNNQIFKIEQDYQAQIDILQNYIDSEIRSLEIEINAIHSLLG